VDIPTIEGFKVFNQKTVMLSGDHSQLHVLNELLKAPLGFPSPQKLCRCL
jgi:hypothetical protein